MLALLRECAAATLLSRRDLGSRVEVETALAAPFMVPTDSRFRHLGQVPSSGRLLFEGGHFVGARFPYFPLS